MTTKGMEAHATGRQWHDDAIAVIGMDCRLPGAESPEAFWANLVAGRDCTTALTDDDLATAGVPADLIADPRYVKRVGLLDGEDGFDADFFGLSRREAELMDPQQRLFLELSYGALERAGCLGASPERNVGVFGGTALNTYLLRAHSHPDVRLESPEGFRTIFTNDKDYVTTRVSYLLDLSGPSINVQTACSTALVAVHLACESLAAGQCDVALAGGTTVSVPQRMGYLYEAGGAFSPDGRCRAFDARASGTVPGNGGAIVALKRVADAVADDDVILAVILGSAINNDGGSKVGYTAPSVQGQTAVIAEAHAVANVTAERISYVEAHGTGTVLGDPIEVEALTRAFRATSDGVGYCALGSAKTNVGHVAAAAGAVGLIKTVLALTHRQIPPSVHFHEPNPAIRFDQSPFFVNDRLTEWESTSGRPRRAGVSAFGIGGTNAHVVVQEGPARAPSEDTRSERPWDLLTLSARDDETLRRRASQMASYLGERPAMGRPDLCFTANVCRPHHERRLALVVRSYPDALDSLAAAARGERPLGSARGGAGEGNAPPRLAFLFTGAGAHYAGMGRGFYDSHEAFRAVLDRCAEILAPHLERPLLQVMFAEPGSADAAYLDRISYTQPAVFALELAMCKLWRSWGVEPDAVLGHSLGELAAACVAGVFPLQDGLELVAARGRLLESLPEGGVMCSVRAEEAAVAEVIAELGGRASIAAINAPTQVVISGVEAAVDQIAARLRADGVETKVLRIPRAGHSPLIDPMLDDFAEVAAGMACSRPRLPLVGNVDGAVVGEEIVDSRYWVRHLREPVRFAQGIRALEAEQITAYLEVGPHPVLIGVGQQCIPDSDAAWLPSLRRGSDGWSTILASLAELYVRAAEIDWSRFAERGRRVVLPSYPFKRERHWVDGGNRASRPRDRQPLAHPLLGAQLPLAGGAIVFERTFAASELPFLDDHRVLDRIVVPGTAYLEIGLAAAEVRYGSGRHAVEELVISRALVLDEHAGRVVQVVLDGEDPDEDASRFRVFSRAATAADDPWTLHATGTLLRSVVEDDRPRTLDIEALRQRCPQARRPEALYRDFEMAGIGYGPTFRGVTEITGGHGEVLARVRPAAEIDRGDASYIAHPATLDAAIQPAFAAAERAGVYMPFEVGRFWSEPIEGELWSHAEVSPRSSEVIELSITLLNPSGRIVGRMEQLRLKRADAEAIAATTNPPKGGELYRLVWQECPRPAQAAAGAAEGHWVIVGDDPLCQHLDERLQQLGGRCARLDWSVFLDGTPGSLGHGAGPLRGVWAVFGRATEAQPADQAAEHVSGDALRLAQQLVRDDVVLDRGLLWATRGAQSTGGNDAVDPASSTVWGLGRVLGLEHPALRLTLVDLDPNDADTSAEASRLVDQVLGARDETELAFRNGRRLAPRLLPLEAGDEASTATPTETETYRLRIREMGRLDTLHLEPDQRRAPGGGEVEIEVLAWGLNFVDVLSATGMLPGGARELGAECAGVVRRVGAGVSVPAPGDRVMALATGGMRRFATVDVRHVVRQPHGLSDVEAATVPVAFLTAWYALADLAGLKAGERVLIHAAASGVGMAAVQLAIHWGAKVYATASSPKHEHVRALGVGHVASSRTAEFGSVFRDVVGAEGMDVVLNSLTGQLVDEGLKLLAPRGRFIELGKTDVRSQAEISASHPDATYRPFDLYDCAPERIQEMLRAIVEGIEKGVLHALPVRTFSIGNACDAFRFMARAQHVGKIALTAPVARAVVRPDASYLITGGLGSLGRHVARWLVDTCGARTLVLATRSRPTAEQLETVAALESRGARVVIERVDVADREALAAVLGRVPEAAPLRGVFHLAGVLEDAPISGQTVESLARVLTPKVSGALHLHELTRALPLDIFCLFSSTAALLGSAGQGNHAAANAFLDGLAHARRVEGLPAISVNWGLWATDAVSGLGVPDLARMARHGVGTMHPDQGLELLGRGLAIGERQLAAFSLAERALRTRPRAEIPAVLRRLVNAVPQRVRPRSPTRGALSAEAAAASPEERPRLIRRAIRREVAKILGFASPQALPCDRPFSELSLDSLMAIELRNQLSSLIGTRVSATIAFDYPTVDALTDHLMSTVSWDEAPPEARSCAGEPERGASVVDEAHQPPGTVPLLPAQRAMLGIHRGLERKGLAPSMFVAMALQSQGTVELRYLRGALLTMIRRHEALRAVFSYTADGWTQTLAPPEEAFFELRRQRVETAPGPRQADPVKSGIAWLGHIRRGGASIAAGLRDRAASRQLRRPKRPRGRRVLSAVTEELEAMLNAPWQLGVDPLIRLVVLEGGSARGDLVLVGVHHVCFDAVSQSAFVRELNIAYGQLVAGARSGTRPPVSTPFSKWADVVNRALQSHRVEANAEEGSARYAIPRTPFDRVAEAHAFAPYAGRHAQALLHGARLRKLALCARNEGTNLTTLLIAALRRSVSRWGEIALPISAVHSGRGELEGIDPSDTIGALVLAALLPPEEEGAVTSVRDTIRSTQRLLSFDAAVATECALLEPRHWVTKIQLNFWRLQNVSGENHLPLKPIPRWQLGSAAESNDPFSTAPIYILLIHSQSRGSEQIRAVMDWKACFEEASIRRLYELWADDLRLFEQELGEVYGGNGMNVM